MKYLNRLFAFDDRQASSKHQSSTTLTSSLYSVTFVPQSPPIRSSKIGHPSSSSIAVKHSSKIIISRSDSETAATKSWRPFTAGLPVATSRPRLRTTTTTTTTVDQTGGRLTSVDNTKLIEDDDDWVLVDEPPADDRTKVIPRKRPDCVILKERSALREMALDKTDIELIKASWNLVRKDPVAAGVLLFKGLFTKFPQYLEFFPHFIDIDIDRMEENKRLLKHAVKVVETVTFVVDSIGDESKTTQLNGALINLVKGHLKRKIGLSEFRNLGIVLIDFICDINNRRDLSGNLRSSKQSESEQCQLNKSSLTESSSSDSETMTSVLDKLRASSSPSSSSEDESFLTNTASNQQSSLQDTNTTTTTTRKLLDEETNKEQLRKAACNSITSKGTKIDTNALVAAWTKLYSSILDLVKREEEGQASG